METNDKGIITGSFNAFSDKDKDKHPRLLDYVDEEDIKIRILYVGNKNKDKKSTNDKA